MPIRTLNNLTAATDMLSMLSNAEVLVTTNPTTLTAASWGFMHNVVPPTSFVNIVLPTYTGSAGMFLGIRNGSSNAAMTVNIATVDSAYPSFNKLFIGESIILMSTGSAYVVVGGQRNPTMFATYSNARQTDLVSGARTLIACGVADYDPRIVMTGGYLTALRHGKYALSGGVGVNCVTGTITDMEIDIDKGGSTHFSIYRGVPGVPANTVFRKAWAAQVYASTADDTFRVYVTCTTSDASVWTIEPYDATNGRITWYNGYELI